MNKRGDVKWLDNWAEISGFILLIIGLIVTFLVNVAMTVIIVFICGIIIGRLYCLKRTRKSGSFHVVTIGFLIGYLLGAGIHHQSLGLLFFVIVFYILGYWVGYGITIRRYVK